MSTPIKLTTAVALILTSMFALAWLIHIPHGEWWLVPACLTCIGAFVAGVMMALSEAL